MTPDRRLHHLADRLAAHVLCTDAFLLPNHVLAERGLTLRKGFPETFDRGALVSTVAALREGAPSVGIPVYSHAVYDVVPGTTTTVSGDGLVVLEGVNALAPEIRDHLDLAAGAWDSINGPNLRAHIGPARERADVVVELAPDHSIVDIADR